MPPVEPPTGAVLRLRLARHRPGPAVARSRIEVRGPVVEIGRRADADLVLDAPGASRRHARLLAVDGTWWIEDLASRAGTWRDGRSLLPGRHRIRSGDVFDVPGLRFALAPPEAPSVRGVSASDLHACARAFATLDAKEAPVGPDIARGASPVEPAEGEAPGAYVEVAAALAALALLGLAVGALVTGGG